MATTNIENKSSKWEQPLTTVEPLMNIIPWKIYFDEITSVVQ